eukprot:9530101-Ditylum_brightwellii.AAC.1
MGLPHQMVLSSLERVKASVLHNYGCEYSTQSQVVEHNHQDQIFFPPTDRTKPHSTLQLLLLHQ